MPIQVPTMEELREVLKAVTAAILRIDVGYQWGGACPEAVAAGYARGTMLYNVFLSLYLTNIENLSIYTDETGCISRILVKA